MIASRVRTFTRQDGSTQVAYNGWPLYYFAQDSRPGDANGQNVDNTWFVVSTHGGPIQNSPLVQVSEHPDLGTIFTEGSGRTVYLFTVDDRDTSNCPGNCAIVWPPLLAAGDPSAGEGVTGDRLGTITREDGYSQVTYNGWPLYYFAPDAVPGDTKGQNVSANWFVVSTDGGPIQTDAMVQAQEYADLGTILTEASGRTLYLYAGDERNRSSCMGQCA